MPVVVQTWRKTSTRPIARTATTATAAANRRGRIVRIIISAPLRHRAEPCGWLDLKNLVLELDTVRGYRGPAGGVKSGYGGALRVGRGVTPLDAVPERAPWERTETPPAASTARGPASQATRRGGRGLAGRSPAARRPPGSRCGR